MLKIRAEAEARARSPGPSNPSQDGPAVRRIPLPFTVDPAAISHPSLSDDWCESHPRSRSPTTGGPPLPVLPAPGAEALVGLFAGDEHPPGIPIPSLALPFLLCGAEHPPNPNLRLFGYLIPPNFEPFGKNCRMYMCTPMSLW